MEQSVTAQLALAQQILRDADVLFDEASVQSAVRRVAHEIELRFAQRYPLLLAVANGAAPFAGQLLALLTFPLEFETIRVSRYRDATRGGELRWLLTPQAPLAGRDVLVIDDILDEGATLLAVRDHLLAQGAQSVAAAVLVDKDLGRDKPLRADFVGLNAPNRYLFGCGMDVKGMWRNLPAIYALREE